MEKKIIEYKVGLIKQIDSLQKNNLVCGHKEFIEECKYCWSNCDATCHLPLSPFY